MGCGFSSADLVGEGVRGRIVKKIAQGGFSEVLLAEDIDSHDKYAVKKVLIHTHEHHDLIKREASYYRRFANCPEIVDLIATLEQDNMVCLVFPYYPGGTVYDLLADRRSRKEYLSPAQVLSITSDMCHALHSIHIQGLAHRDLKTANFLLNESGRAILTDFGSMVEVPVLISNTTDCRKWIDDCAEHCSMPYRAPELFTCEVQTQFDASVDMWSLGCCIYALCYFVSPFDLTYERGESIALAVQSPERINYPEDASCHSSNIISLIKGLLKVEPAERIKLEEIQSRLAEIST